MNNDPYILITSDTHAGASHDVYREYLDPKYRSAFDDWRAAYRNPSQKHIGSKKKRNWDNELRMQEQYSQGVVGEVVFPNTVPPFYRKSIVIANPPGPKEYERCLAGIRAHNRWLADFCKEYPHQRAGIGLILLNDIDEAIKDIEWIAKNDLRGGVLLPLIPDDAHWLKPIYHESYAPIWAAIEDCGLVMNQHSGQGLPNYDDGGDGAVARSIWVSETAFYSKRGHTHLLMSGIFEQHPKLRYILTESGCAWAQPTLEQLDRIHYGIKAGAIGELDYSNIKWKLKEPPSFYARRNCWYGASFPSPEELNGRDKLGVDKICWGNDYPHYEGTFPHNLLTLQLTFHDISDQERRMILGGNAAELYNFDLDALKPLADQHGPTAQEIAQPVLEIPENATCQLLMKEAEARRKASAQQQAHVGN